MTRVVVVGGGVVGLCTAYFLRKGGADVTVLERDRIGSGASLGNAGEICPVLTTPIASPGILLTAVKNLYRKDSALYIHPAAIPAYSRFLLSLARRSNTRDYRLGAALLRRFGEPTFQLFDELAGDGVDAELVKDDYLYVYPTEDLTRRRMAQLASIHGPSFRTSPAPLGRSELAALEPGLGTRARSGFLVHNQAHLNPDALVAGLAAVLRDNGVSIDEGARVTAIREAGKQVAVHSSRGTALGDAVVVAAGAGSASIVRHLGVRLPIRAGKGYSFTIAPPQPIRRVIKLEEAHVGVIPLSSGVRLAGTMEFDSDVDRFNARRIEAVIEAARPYLPGVSWEARTREWVGARPMTPDGLPWIGRLPRHPRVLVAAGHNMLGVMLAPATGKAVADLLNGRDVPSVAAFRPDRF